MGFCIIHQPRCGPTAEAAEQRHHLNRLIGGPKRVLRRHGSGICKPPPPLPFSQQRLGPADANRNVDTRTANKIRKTRTQPSPQNQTPGVRTSRNGSGRRCIISGLGDKGEICEITHLRSTANFRTSPGKSCPSSPLPYLFSYR